MGKLTRAFDVDEDIEQRFREWCEQQRIPKADATALGMYVVTALAPITRQRCFDAMDKREPLDTDLVINLLRQANAAAEAAVAEKVVLEEVASHQPAAPGHKRRRGAS